MNTRINTRFIVVVIIACGILGGILFFVFRNDDTPKNYPSRGTNIIAFGDSLVSGVGAKDGNNFVSLLSRQIDTPIINAGRPGDTTETALSRLSRDVLERDPKIVLVLLGGNDFLSRVPKDTMIGNLRQVIALIQERGAVVILLGVRGGLITDAYEKDLKKLAEEMGAAYVSNVLDGLITKPEYMYDGIHPNDAGHSIIAERIRPVLEELLLSDNP